MDLFLRTTATITAVVEEMPALVADQSVPCCCDPFVGSVADPFCFSLQKTIHHFSEGQDIDHLATIRPGSQFDVSLLCQTECLVLAQL